MRNFAEKTLGVALTIVVFLISSQVLAQEQPRSDQIPATKQPGSVSAPDLADIIPRATKLSADMAILEKRIAGVPDVSELEKKIARIEESLREPATLLQQIKDSTEGSSIKLVELRRVTERQTELFNEISRPLSEAIRQLDTWRTAWQAEKRQWNEFQSALLRDGDLAQLQSIIEKAQVTIDKALEIVRLQLSSMLALQESAGNVQAKISALRIELDSLISTTRSGVRISISPPMFTPQYFSQYSKELWYSFQKGLGEIWWPDSRFFDRLGWIVFFQVVLSIFVIITIYRNRSVLQDSKSWHFLVARPFSAGLFFGIIALMWFYEYQGSHDTWGFFITIVASISFGRLASALNVALWKKQFVYGLIIALTVTRMLQVITLPIPLFRIYTVLVALVGLVFCWRWAAESGRQEEPGIYRWLLRAGACLFAFIIIAEIWGKQGLAEFLLLALIRSTATVLGFMLFMYMLRGSVEWLLRRLSLQRSVLFYRDVDTIVRRATLFIDVALCGLLLLPANLMIWGVFDTLPAAINGLLDLGFNLGSQRISIGLLIISAAILYGSFLASWMVQRLLIDEVLARRRVETGVRVSIARLVHYILIFIGFVLALLALGFEFTKLTIVLSALGIGIGFGLQSIVNNFVSGLILLFERPVRVGDFIELGTNWAEIKKIGLRATTVQTFDQADVIIPNADLVTNQVVNWTLSNRRVRLIIPVGVAYGSDTSLVMETLLASAKDNTKIAKAPAPQVLFLNFGESALDFELRVWVLDADNRLIVSSELHQEIDRRFREAKIEIAFPQRDLHLRSVDGSVILRPPEKTE